MSYDYSADPLHAGSVIPALDTGDPSQVYPRHDPLAWLKPAFELTLGVVMMTGLALVLIGEQARWRLGRFLSAPFRFALSRRHAG